VNLFSSISLSVSIFCSILAVCIFKYAKGKIHYLWACFNIAAAIWALGEYFAGSATTAQNALLSWRLAYGSATFISVFFYHLVCSFAQIKKPKTLLFVYLQGLVFFVFICFSDHYIHSTIPVFDIPYYQKATPLFSLWLMLWIGIVCLSFFQLGQFIKEEKKGLRKVQALFLFWGMIVGFIGGVSTAIPAYGISFYPIWQASICVYVLILTYAILRHNFLEVKIVLRRLIVPSSICTIGFVSFFSFYLKLSLFSIASLSLSASCLLLAFLVLSYAKDPSHRIWAFFNLAVASWAIGTFFAGISRSADAAGLAWRWAYGAGVFVPSVFYHFVYSFCELKKKKILLGIYAIALIFLPLNLIAPGYITEIAYIYESIYYHKATPLFSLFVLYVGVVVFMSFSELIRYLHVAKGNKSRQALYLVSGFGIGWGGGISTFLPPYGIPIYPAWHFSICVYTLIATYAIFKFQIMDIKIAVTRLGIFSLVYSIVLGLPFGMGFLGRRYLEPLGYYGWLIPTGLSSIFATIGPSIYLFLQRKAEARLLQEEIRTQHLLMQASRGMNAIHHLTHLIDFIIDIVVKVLRVTKVEIFLFDAEAGQYQKKATNLERNMPLAVEVDSEVIDYLKSKKFTIVYEKMKMLASSADDQRVYFKICGQMKKISASVLVPLIMDDTMLGFIVLGERSSGEMFSRELLNALTVLGNQAALAIENCNYIELEVRMREESFSERVKSLDHMASSMAHEIDNPMHGVRTSIAFIRDFIICDPRFSLPEPLNADLKEAVVRSARLSERVSAMVKAILDYSRLGTGQLMPSNIHDAWEGFLELIKPYMKSEKIQLKTDVRDDLPLILGDKIQLEEIFMNFFQNALHATKLKERQEISFKIFSKNKQTVRIECRDNGYGIKKEILKDIFLSSMTTKGSSEGTGLGLYRVRKIVDLFKGKVWAESKGKGHGATLIVEFPVLRGNMENLLKNNIANRQKRGKK